MTDCRIFGSQDDLTDHYYGPCTLFALCKEFCDAVLSRKETQVRYPEYFSGDVQQCEGLNEQLQSLLTRLYGDASPEEAFDLHSAHSTIGPPQKQLLLIAQSQFFQQADYTTDIFVQSNFLSHVDSIYSRPVVAQADEAWAICFNVIILLFLGPENPNRGKNDLLLGPRAVRQILDTVRMALSNPQIVMVPKLVNVQALTLLVSSEYYEGTIFYVTDEFYERVSPHSSIALRDLRNRSLLRLAFWFGLLDFIKCMLHPRRSVQKKPKSDSRFSDLYIC
jgi:hypothetical protein